MGHANIINTITHYCKTLHLHRDKLTYDQGRGPYARLLTHTANFTYHISNSIRFKHASISSSHDAYHSTALSSTPIRYSSTAAIHTTTAPPLWTTLAFLPLDLLRLKPHVYLIPYLLLLQLLVCPLLYLPAYLSFLAHLLRFFLRLMHLLLHLRVLTVQLLPVLQLVFSLQLIQLLLDLRLLLPRPLHVVLPLVCLVLLLASSLSNVLLHLSIDICPKAPSPQHPSTLEGSKTTFPHILRRITAQDDNVENSRHPGESIPRCHNLARM